MSPAGCRDGRAGYILVAVLAVVVVLSGLVAAGAVVIRSALGAARVADADVRAAGLLASGVEVAAFQLAVLGIDPAMVDGRRIRLTDGTVTAHVTDEAGKVDLNAASPKLIAGVLAGVGMEEGAATAAVARIVALRGPADGVIPENGAAATPALPGSLLPPLQGGVILQAGAPSPSGGRTKRRGLRSVEDLLDIAEIPRGAMPLLRQRMTVYNPDGRLNVMTASPAVLMSMPGMTSARLAQVLAAREAGRETGQETDRQVASAAQAALGGDFASFVKVLPGPAFALRIDAVGAGGRRKSVAAVVAASKSPAEPYYILDWLE